MTTDHQPSVFKKQLILWVAIWWAYVFSILPGNSLICYSGTPCKYGEGVASPESTHSCFILNFILGVLDLGEITIVIV